MDIFKGFPDEESIVNYTLNQAYQDNVTVFASMSLGASSSQGSLKCCPIPAVPWSQWLQDVGLLVHVLGG